MKFKFYSASYVKDGVTYSDSAEVELESLQAAADTLNSGTLVLHNLNVAFTPVYCEKVEE